MKKLLDLPPNALLEARNLEGCGAPMAAPVQLLVEGSWHCQGSLTLLVLEAIFSTPPV